MFRFFQCFMFVLILTPGALHAKAFYEDPLVASMEVWVREALRNSLSYSHTDFKQRQDDNKKFFTEEAHEFYLKFVDHEGRFGQQIINGKWDMITVDKKSKLGQREKIRYEELDVDDDGMHHWRVHLPLDVHLVKDRERMHKEHEVYPHTAVVDVKQTRVKAPYGFVIYNWAGVSDYDPYAIDRIHKP